MEPYQSLNENYLQIHKDDTNNETSTNISKFEEESKEGSSWYTAVILITNVTIGCGIVSQPKAYELSGNLATAIIIHLSLCLVSMIMQIIWAYVSDANQRNNCQDVIFDYWGSRGLLLSSLSILLNEFFTASSLLIVTADQLEEFFIYVDKDFYCKKNPWYMSRTFSTIVVILFLVPFCLGKRFNFLRCISATGTIAFLYVPILVLVKYIQLDSPPPARDSKSEISLIYIFANIIFCYESHLCSIPIYSCMKRRTVTEFSKVVMSSYTFITACYLIVAIFGYLTFGSEVTSDILLSYKNPDISILVALNLISIKTITTFPSLEFTARAAARSLWCLSWNISDEEAERKERFHNTTITIILLIFSVVFAISFTDVGEAIIIVLPIAIINIFVLPGLCLLKTGLRIEDKEIRKRHLIITSSILILIMGSTSECLSLVYVAVALNVHKEQENACDFTNKSSYMQLNMSGVL